MELVPGEDLADRLAGGRLPVDDATDVCHQIAESLGLAFARIGERQALRIPRATSGTSR